MTGARPCPACMAEAASAAGSVNGFEMVRCRACGTLFTAALPASGEGMDYGGQEGAGTQVPAFVEERLGDVVDDFSRYRMLGRWLDIGCGAGTLLRAAAARGWEAIGTEVAPGRVEAARAEGLDVRLGELEALDLERGGFDIVSLVEVVEHVDTPADVVASAGRLVRPGGALYLTTPHGRGISARLLRSRWSVVAPPEHLQLLSIRGVRTMLERTGFDPTWIRTHATNPHELLRAMRDRQASTATQRKQTGYRLNESLSANPAGSIAKDAANAVLNQLRLGDTLKVRAERVG